MFLKDLQQYGKTIQEHLDNYLSSWGDQDIVFAMRHALGGGKRLRAYLALKGAAAYNIPINQSIWPACAIEAIHAYSLVHDDLPCMDDDDLRRGMPAVHKKWNDATAVLAGDALQSLGFELVLNPACSQKDSIRNELALSLAKASGGQGMVLGQALDIAAESVEVPLDIEQITSLQRAKTGALFGWAVKSGAVLAEEDPTLLSQYAQAVGLAFQISDDVLDVQGDPEKTGKRLLKDATAGKATFVSLLGIEQAKARSQELIDQACDAVSPLGKGAQPLQQCAKFIISRDR